MKKQVLFALLALALLSKLWASAGSRWESFLNKIRSGPDVRTSHDRKGVRMRTRTTQQGLEAERVWGVEALDPLKQREWVAPMLERLRHAPVLILTYSPPAERAAIRALNTLARLYRQQDSAALVHMAESESNLLLEPLAPAPSGLALIHRASRFVNWRDWLAEIGAHQPRCAVLTVACTEADPLLDFLQIAPIRIPEEEGGYCESKAYEILNKYFGALPPRGEPLKEYERLLIEAGVAEVAVPVGLLARHLGTDGRALSEAIRASRLKEFVSWSEFGPEAVPLVSFRGAWLARKIAPEARLEERTGLFELAASVNLTARAERVFLLSLLMALRAQGHEHQVEIVQQRYPTIFAQARQLAASCPERQAWACFDSQACCGHTNLAKV